jgi:hypothetical protein
MNRNIFFVDGAYQAKELRSDPHQRLRLLTKLFENVAPIETAVAVRIAARFQAVTGDSPVKHGNSANTRTVSGGGAFVVARNLAFNREHDGPVVVTEPYFFGKVFRQLDDRSTRYSPVLLKLFPDPAARPRPREMLIELFRKGKVDAALRAFKKDLFGPGPMRLSGGRSVTPPRRFPTDSAKGIADGSVRKGSAVKVVAGCSLCTVGRRRRRSCLDLEWRVGQVRVGLASSRRWNNLIYVQS